MVVPPKQTKKRDLDNKGEKAPEEEVTPIGPEMERANAKAAALEGKDAAIDLEAENMDKGSRASRRDDDHE